MSDLEQQYIWHSFILLDTIVNTCWTAYFEAEGVSVSFTDSSSAVSISSFIVGLFFGPAGLCTGILCQIKTRDVLMIFYTENHAW